MSPLILTSTWGEFLVEVVKSPQNYVFWLIIFLVVLFMLSRLRNVMEERGVNRAIYISRGFVGTFIAFVVTPIVFYIMLNLVAMVHGVNTIDIGFLAKWLALTVTSYWWLLKCFFGAVDVVNAEQLYSLDAVVRILWILLPFSFIWLRVSNTRIGKLFLIPIIIGTLVITRYKTAPPTFITESEGILERIPGLKWLKASEDTTNGAGQAILDANKRRIVAAGLIILIIIGFSLGFQEQRRVIGLLLALIGVMGLILFAPNENKKTIPDEHHEDYHTNVDSLVMLMDSIQAVNPENLEIYYLSQKVSAAYEARIVVGEIDRFPEELCERYHSYFYDWCKQ